MPINLTLFSKSLTWLFLTLIISQYTNAKDLIKIEGSSTVYPITLKVAQQFMLAEGTRTQVVIGISGTGGGFRKFCRGRTDISNASRPIKAAEKKLCLANGIEFIELPVALDAITIVVNKNNDWLDAISLSKLHDVWHANAENRITTWDAIDPSYPNAPLALHGPGTDSGTYDYFVDVVLDKEASRKDYAANEDDEAMAAEVATNKNALAFLGFAYYVKNQEKLRAVAVSDNESNPIVPSINNVTNGSYSALSRPLFIYVNKASLDNRQSIRRFLYQYMKQNNIQKSVVNSGYIPLSADMYTVARSILMQGRTGSVFNSDDLDTNFERFLYQQ